MIGIELPPEFVIRHIIIFRIERPELRHFISTIIEEVGLRVSVPRARGLSRFSGIVFASNTTGIATELRQKEKLT
jgi:hypothetical protein